MRSRIEKLHEDNIALKKRLDAELKQIDALSKNLRKEQDEQRRFREMMATNFDLLEQSVALSLAKSIGNKAIVEPDELKIRDKAQSPVVPKREMTPGKNSVTSSAGTINPKAGSNTSPSGRGGWVPQTRKKPASPVVASRNRAHSPKVVVAIGGVGTARNMRPAAVMHDPDLIPPRNPRRLEAHRAAKALYDKGFALFARKEYDQAIMVYENFLARFPGDIYSDNAQFWIAESHFRQNQLSQAEASYRKVLRRYEHRSTLQGYKTPESIYRIGLTYRRRHDAKRAGYYFENVARRFPDTSAGRKAQKELESLAVKTAGNGPYAPKTPGS